ncbi:macrolide ABC transporter permease/ATP-binding protein MacB [Zobellella endophytica]|uniref:Pyoverdine export ATP-binding/permease protein PvdT n=1 Tax=Zobellella endophytica TaxID=2116700 RepID=A0A2P7R0K7_9GAMM|nr:MacB family efflux pump subunit [Zobellella endophytica]PSJ43754.1 macrolide ABC transporter permease/ATP-binding protein MacB [Zobellella endophytica]
MSSPLIELRGITKQYGAGELATRVLHGIDLTINKGEFVAIMGSSGSGKSTLMHLLGCLDQPSGGEYRLQGRDVASLSGDELARLRRDTFGFVFQSYHLLGGASARENVEVPAIYSGLSRPERRARAEQLLSTLGLASRLEHKPSQLSGGQQQRVSIARALMNGGDIILADEPTGALDSRSGAEVMALLTGLARRGHTVILITHDPKVAAQADRIIEISDGRILADPGPATAREDGAAPARPRPAGSLAAELLEAVRTALRSLRSNLFRAALTLLGIVIGVASVITMLAIGNGSQQQVVQSISAMGSNLLLVRPGAPNQWGRRATSTLVPEDMQAVRELANVSAAVPEIGGSATLRFGNLDHSPEINATSADFPAARQWALSQGTFFTEEDEQSYATVAVLGQSVVDALFPDTEPLGQYVMVNNILFQVIGVMAPKGASPWGQDQDDVVFVPYTTGGLRLFGQRFLRNITVSVAEVARIGDTETEIHRLLLARHGVEDFQIRNMSSIIDTVSATTRTFTWLLGSIAAISLLVGGIGVMNIMLVSVTERTREIGIRMATGARTRHILQQFLTEALVVSALGGAIGVVLGLAAAAVLAAFEIPVYFSPAPVLLAFGCAFATGLVFGWLPARKAARLDPVVALASE